MKTISIILLVLLVFACATTKETTLTGKINDLTQAKTALAELGKALKKEKGQLWDYRLDGPVMFVNKDTRLIVANENNAEETLKEQDGLFVGELPNKRNTANTATEWGGKRWTMVVFPLPETKAERLNLLIHESFHRIQPFIGFDSIGGQQSKHLDEKEARIYLKLEFEALKKALQAKEPTKHIKDALKFRKYRHQLYPKAKVAENSLELHEGLAEYTGSILSGRTYKELRAYYVSKIDWANALPSFVRSFAYFTTPVYGYFMQRSNKNWNHAIDRKTNLTDYILNFYHINDGKIDKSDIAKLGKLYQADSIIAFEEGRYKERLKLLEAYREKFLDKDAFKISLEKMSISFNPSNITPLDTLGTVYPFARITDQWGILKVDSGGVLLGPNWNKVTLSSPSMVTDSIVAGNGWKIMLSPQWTVKRDSGRYQMGRK